MFKLSYGTKALSSSPSSKIRHPTHIKYEKKKNAQDPLRALRATMCQGHRHEHAACGHLHWFEAVRKCRGYSHSKDACFGHVTTLSKVKVRIPARCNDCFHRAVADVERNCNGCIAAVMRQVDSYDADLKAESNSTTRGAMHLAKSLLKKDIAEFTKRRDHDIAALRAEQGM